MPERHIAPNSGGNNVGVYVDDRRGVNDHLDLLQQLRAFGSVQQFAQSRCSLVLRSISSPVTSSRQGRLVSKCSLASAHRPWDLPSDRWELSVSNPASVDPDRKGMSPDACTSSRYPPSFS